MLRQKNAGHALFSYCGVVLCFVFVASLNSVSFWVTSTSQRWRKLIEFWDQSISLRLCSLCSSSFWYVHCCLYRGALDFIYHHHKSSSLLFSRTLFPINFLKTQEVVKNVDIRKHILFYFSFIHSFKSSPSIFSMIFHLYMYSVQKKEVDQVQMYSFLK